MDIYISVDKDYREYKIDIWDHLPKYSGGIFIPELGGELMKSISKSESVIHFGVVPNPGEVYKVASKAEKVEI